MVVTRHIPNRLRRLLGLRPTLTLYGLRDDPLSALVTTTMRRHAEAAGYRVRERNL
jgi:hypothetical protein